MRKVLHFFDLLEDVDAEWIAMRGTRSFVEAGHVLIHEGQDIQSVYIVIDGELSVSSRASRNQVIATLLAGEVVGEMSFVDSRPPSASVIARRNSTLLCIPRDLVLEKMTKDTGFAARFYRGIATFLSDRLKTTVSHFGYGGAIEESDPTELDDEAMDRVSLAAARFDNLMQRFQTT
jgi:CRP/FNR family transcriptional regulator, cyclic AMP receptor protein